MAEPAKIHPALDAVFTRLGRVSPATVRSWVEDGIPLPDGSRVKLKAFLYRKNYLATVDAVDEFLSATASAPRHSSAEVTHA